MSNKRNTTNEIYNWFNDMEKQFGITIHNKENFKEREDKKCSDKKSKVKKQ